MLPKKHRLTRAQVAEIVRRGTAFHSPHLTLRVLPSPDGSYRFGFAAGKKVSRGAVGRNRLRRRGYGALERLLPASPPRLEGIFFFKPGSLALTPSELNVEIESLLKRILSR
ncbi:MAG: ribonuclease P protein component [bacterium]|nr:ribonuclease P protein component [bacterium]